MISASEAASELSQLQSLGQRGVVQCFERYRPQLARMVALRLDARIVGKVDVDDVLQDAFCEAARRREDYLARPTVPFFVWLRQITSQVLIDVHRRYLGAQMRDASREVSLNQWATASSRSACLLAQLADSLTSPSQCAVRNELVTGLRAALQRLQETDREVLILRHLEEMSNDEVAEILGIDKYAASKRYLRALQRLQALMASRGDSACDGDFRVA